MMMMNGMTVMVAYFDDNSNSHGSDGRNLWEVAEAIQSQRWQ